MNSVTKYDIIKPSKEVVGNVELKGTKVVASNSVIESLLEDMTISGYTVKDGKDFFNVLPRGFKSGYLLLKKSK